ncbi:MAG: transcriptional regulator [Clostridia bacterium]|jgi:repressor LexA|nr:transcriptional regulator [Clostridia bacterium]
MKDKSYEIDQKVLNENIKTLRKKRGFTLEELGDKIGVSRGTIRRYETGEIENISTTTIVSLANALKVTPAQLVGWEHIGDTGNNVVDEIISRLEKMDNEQLQSILTMIDAVSKTWGDTLK